MPPPPRPERSEPGKRVVVIDAGHGGVDPGAIGVSGSYEKDITLSAARAVKRTLEATGRYRVYLTRDRDVYIPFRERFQRADQAGASLLSSLHAHSTGNDRPLGPPAHPLSALHTEEPREG